MNGAGPDPAFREAKCASHQGYGVGRGQNRRLPVILMVHWGPPAASTLVRVFVSACPALAAHLLCDCPHAHGDLQASHSAVDVRGTIGAARHLILPGCCLIEMSARHRPLAPPVCSAIPRPLARSGDSKDNGHQVKNVTSPAACGQRCLSRRRKGVGGVSARASHPVTGA